MMRQQIEAALHPLLGEPLSDMMRYAGCQKFEFGVQRPKKNRKGQNITLADWGLVIACDWRITGTEGIVVSSDDFGPGRERRDGRVAPFYDRLENDPPVVQAMQADENGGLHFALSHGYVLEVLTSAASD